MHDHGDGHMHSHAPPGSNGEAVLKTSDAGIVAVRPNAEFVAERYASDGLVVLSEPQARLHLAAGAGHNLLLERPEICRQFFVHGDSQ